jgi:hypothetical protein
MIMSESVGNACAQVGDYDDETMMGEFDRFFKAQPAICDFVVELTNESSQQIQEITLFLAYMIFKAIEAGRASGTAALDAVTPAAIEAAYRNSEVWIDRVSQAEGTNLDATIVSSLEQDTEPFLLQYVISELNESLEDGAELNDEEKGEVFFVLKTVISSLSASDRRIIDTQ